MKLTIECLDKENMCFQISEDYDVEGCNHIVHGFWRALWDSFMITIHFMKKVRDIKNELTK